MSNGESEGENRQSTLDDIDWRLAQPYPWRDGDLLHELYIEREMLPREIAEKLDCGSSTVRDWLKRNDIPTRSISEAKQLRSDPFVPLNTTSHGYEVWWHENDTVYVHRLLAVAKYGFDAVDSDRAVHHENEIPWDNRPENIQPMEWGKHSTHHNSKLTWLDRLRIAERYRSGASSYDLAPVFDVDQATIINTVQEINPDLVRGYGGSR